MTDKPDEPTSDGHVMDAAGYKTKSHALSSKAIAVLEMIAQGHSYEQIIVAHPALTYRDIFDAAQEVVDAFNQIPSYTSGMDKVREHYPRAYELWTVEEENRLRTLLQEGYSVARIARQLQRQRSAIRSRIRRLDLVEMLSLKEQDRLKRIEGRNGLSHDE